MILDLLRNAFDAHPTASMPPSLKKNSLLEMNYIADRLRQLKNADPRNCLQGTHPYFQNFRTDWLRKRGAAAVGATSAPPAQRLRLTPAPLLVELAPASQSAVPRKHRLRQL